MNNGKLLSMSLVMIAILALVYLMDVWYVRGEMQAKAMASGAEVDPPIYVPLVMHDGPPYVPTFVETSFGIEVKPKNYNAGLQKIAEASTSFTRLNGVLWANVEPEEGQRNWTALAAVEERLLTAAEHDVRAILVVRHTPPWAQEVSGSYCGPIKEEKLGAFANFMKELVARYSVAPYYVKYWEIYNEPDVAPDLVGSTSAYGCWGDAGDSYYGGGYFATMLKAVYPKIKEADPGAKVIVGGILMSCDPGTGKCSSDEEALASKFFEGILANGGKDFFDGIAFHNYDIYMFQIGAYWSRKWDSAWDTTGPALIAKARFLNDLMDAYGVSGKFMMNTETALLCGSSTDPPGGPGCESAPDSDYELTKAYYIAESYAAAITEGLVANIWYSLPGWRNSGLVYTDLTDRPAFTAYQFSLERLAEADYLGPVGSQDIGGDAGLGGYKFERPNGSIVWIVWAWDRNSHAITLSEPPDVAWDVFGNEMSVSNPATFSITLEPRYFQWNP